MVIRLNKYLAEKIGLSRRQADDFIAAGKVLVNGTPAILGARISGDEKISVNGKAVDNGDIKYTYIMLNKPVGYVCSRKQQGDSPTLYDLLPDEYKSLKTVGRLDRNSSGIILLSNDGDFNFQMTHPSFVKTKVYHVELDKALQPLHQQMISDFGIQLDDGLSKLILTSESDDRKKWQVEMHEGRNRQIRRTFSALGYEVVMLHRETFGKYTLGELKSGEFVEITK